ncbi:MAG: FAD-dependent oxidoreductase, partial [Pseudomonadota bacterium]|nr:FAD-dependent oxidoreductase [Pseudomonadota bacterium]
TKTGHVLADEIGVSPSLGPNIPNVSVPYGALVPDSVDNMLVAGRHISSDAQTHTFMREIPQCWMTGHAAGVAAALSANSGTRPRDLAVLDIQSALIKQGAYVRTQPTQ